MKTIKDDHNIERFTDASIIKVSNVKITNEYTTVELSKVKSLLKRYGAEEKEISNFANDLECYYSDSNNPVLVADVRKVKELLKRYGADEDEVKSFMNDLLK